MDNRGSSESAGDDRSPFEIAGELKELLVSYAKQETTDPLRALLNWVKFGVAGAVCVFVGAIFLALGLLRLLQNEVGAFDDDLSFLPYLITAAVVLVGAGLAGFAATRDLNEGS